MLLGLALAQATGVDNWLDFNQTKLLPEYLQGQIRFANHGSPKTAGAVPGYDRTSYNRAPGGLGEFSRAGPTWFLDVLWTFFGFEI